MHMIHMKEQDEKLTMKTTNDDEKEELEGTPIGGLTNSMRLRRFQSDDFTFTLLLGRFWEILLVVSNYSGRKGTDI